MLPDRKLTPGRVARSDKERSGVTEEMERRVFSRYHIPWRSRPEFKIDHLIPVELGGADTVDNLWPQSLYAKPYNPASERTIDQMPSRSNRCRTNDPAGAKGNKRRLDFLFCRSARDRLFALTSRSEAHTIFYEENFP